MEPPTRPLVTIGMVVKDCQETILESIKSINDQTYPHQLLEIVVVDGGSKDTTLSIITKATRDLFANIPLSISSDAGRGLGFARQLVVNQAQGDYVLWVDSDATIPENYVSSLVEFIEHHPRHGGARGIQEASIENENLLARLESIPLVLRTTPRNIFDTDGQIFRVRAINEVGGFDVVIKGAGEDIDLILRMIKAGWAFSVVKIKFRHRIGPWRQIFQKRIRAG